MPPYRWLILLFSLLLVGACSQSSSDEASPASAEVVASSQMSATHDEIASTEAPIHNAAQVRDHSTTRQTRSPLVPSDSGQVKLPLVDPLEVRGNLTLNGSITVFPLTERLYRRFTKEGYRDIIKMNSLDTAYGLSLLCTGQTDIAAASRRIKAAELEACLAQGYTPVEFQIGIDAITIVVNQSNSFVTDLSLDELRLLFTAELWSMIDPTWPNLPIARSVPDLGSGTLDFVVERALAGQSSALIHAPNTEMDNNFELLVQNVLANPLGVAVVSHAHYLPYTQHIQALAIEGNKPTKETVSQGHYLLTRPLFLYASLETIAQKPQVNAFLNFFLTHINEEIEQIGYYPASSEVLDHSKTKLLETKQNTLAIASSSTIFPLAQAMQTRFEQRYSTFDLDINNISSRAGFQRFCEARRVDIALTSRTIKLDEAISCTVNGRTPLAFRVATDALTLVVNSDNGFVQDVTLAEVAAIFTAERWADVNPAWPDAPIERFISPPTSGAFDFFVEEVFAGDPVALLQADNTIQSQDNDLLIRGVAANLYSVGFLPYSFYQQNIERLNALKINGIALNIKTVERGDYPLAHPLFLYTDLAAIKRQPQVAAYLNFFLRHTTIASEKLGYIPANQLSLEASQAKLRDSMLTESVPPKSALVLVDLQAQIGNPFNKAVMRLAPSFQIAVAAYLLGARELGRSRDVAVIHRARRILAATPWPEEVNDDAAALMTVLDGYAQILSANNLEAVEPLVAEINTIQRDFAEAVFTWLGEKSASRPSLVREDQIFATIVTLHLLETDEITHLYQHISTDRALEKNDLVRLHHLHQILTTTAWPEVLQPRADALIIASDQLRSDMSGQDGEAFKSLAVKALEAQQIFSEAASLWLAETPVSSSRLARKDQIFAVMITIHLLETTELPSLNKQSHNNETMLLSRHSPAIDRIRRVLLVTDWPDTLGSLPEALISLLGRYNEVLSDNNAEAAEPLTKQVANLQRSLSAVTATWLQESLAEDQ